MYWRRWLRDESSGRVQALVADLKIIRHGVRTAGEKPEPLVRLRRGLATCAEPGGFPAGLAILRDCAGTYGGYIQPTLQRIGRRVWLLLPLRAALALQLELRRTRDSLNGVWARVGRSGAGVQPPRDADATTRGTCRQAEATLQSLETRLRLVEAYALKLVRADLLTEVSAACEALWAEMKETGVAFGGIEITGEPGARVFIEASELRRCLHDVLQNAIEASRDAADPRVAVAVACGERRVTIRIADNGRGVAREDHEAIFHGKSTKVPPGGTGLSHARAIVEAHSGMVRVRESEPWHRTEFEIELCRVPS
jgi:signal transduction histidine kinase